MRSILGFVRGSARLALGQQSGWRNGGPPPISRRVVTWRVSLLRHPRRQLGMQRILRRGVAVASLLDRPFNRRTLLAGSAVAGLGLTGLAAGCTSDDDE